jgi:hypothetical protein
MRQKSATEGTEITEESVRPAILPLATHDSRLFEVRDPLHHAMPSAANTRAREAATLPLPSTRI